MTSSTIATADIAANAVTLAKLATQGANTALANVTSGTAVPTAASIPAGVQFYTSGTGYSAATSAQILTACTGCAPLASPTFTGTVTYPLIATTTHCAGAGTAANPSVASCSAAPSGFFSCATNASTGTCQVNTTAVTANSVIQIQPDSTLGTALSVTCNTTADSGLTSPRVSARSAGTSFTITMGTYSTNPECFSSWATTYNAATCSQTDVQTAINSTSNGDTVIIPACSSTNWSSGITISGKGIDITGSGTPNTGSGTVGAGTSTTTLIETGTSPFFSFTGLAYGQTAKVELLNLGTTQTSPVITGAVTFAGTCTSSGCAQVRVDNILFATNEWGAALDGAPIVVDNIFGVADHNSESDNTSSPFLTDISFDAWQGVGAYGDNSFANSSSFGTAQSFYIENNSVSGVRLTENDVAPPGGAVGGARWVCRFNTVTNMSGNGICGGHGTAWGGRFRGERQQEVYYNTISASVCNVINSVLSGTGLLFEQLYHRNGV